METESSLRNIVLNKKMMMDNVQKYNICTSLLSLQESDAFPVKTNFGIRVSLT
jgi:hypothetical protein